MAMLYHSKNGYLADGLIIKHLSIQSLSAYIFQIQDKYCKAHIKVVPIKCFQRAYGSTTSSQLLMTFSILFPRSHHISAESCDSSVLSGSKQSMG